MREEVARTRADGYAFNPGHIQPSSWGEAVTVMDQQGRCAGALSIAAMESRLTLPRREELAALLQAEAQRLAARLEHPAPAAPRRVASRGLSTEQDGGDGIMSEASIVGWSHSPFGKLEEPDVEALDWPRRRRRD